MRTMGRRSAICLAVGMALLVLVALTGSGASPPPAVATDLYQAVAMTEAVISRERASYRAGYKETSSGLWAASPQATQQFNVAMERLRKELAERGDRYLQQCGDDPRRWRVIVWLLDHQPAFVDATGTTDEASREAWRRRLTQWKAALDAAQDLPADLSLERARADWEWRWRAAGKLAAIQAVEELRSSLMNYLDQLPSPSDQALKAAMLYLRKIETGDLPEDVLPREYGLLANLAREDIRSLARGKLESRQRRARLSSRPVELTFTALDGRQVDLAALRGGIVLIDFWATTCSPCIAEFPHLQRLYEQYRDQGLEIIGVSLDSVKDRNKVQAFVARRKLPWPQHFPGDHAARQFGVTAIPATFLLDPDGMVVGTNLKGAPLQEMIKRLLRTGA